MVENHAEGSRLEETLALNLSKQSLLLGLQKQKKKEKARSVAFLSAAIFVIQM